MAGLPTCDVDQVASLPLDVLALIFSHLPARMCIVVLRSVCRRWRTAVGKVALRLPPMQRAAAVRRLLALDPPLKVEALTSFSHIPEPFTAPASLRSLSIHQHIEAQSRCSCRAFANTSALVDLEIAALATCNCVAKILRHNAHTLTRLVFHHLPSLASDEHVSRTLSLRYFPRLAYLSLTIPKSFAPTALKLATRHASSLTHLHIADSPGGPFPREIYELFRTPFPNLRSLCIGWRPFEPLAITNNRHNFPKLASLGAVFLNTELTYYLPALRAMPELLTSLEVWMRDELMPPIEEFTRLTSLSFVFLSQYFATPIVRAARLAPHLKCLSLDMALTTEPEEPIPLQHFTALTELEVAQFTSFPTLRLPLVRTIRIMREDFLLEARTRLAVFDAFPALRTVHLILRGTIDWPLHNLARTHACRRRRDAAGSAGRVPRGR